MPADAGSPVDTQEREIAAFLSDAATYGGGVSRVDLIETHIARVFLAGDEVYKVKKRVKLPFLDFSTLAMRHRAAAREIEINQPHAPGIYLGLVPIVRDARGRLALGGEGETVDWAVHMRRFPQEAVLIEQARRGPLADNLTKELAGMVARYHRDSPIVERNGKLAFEPVMRQLTEAFGGEANEARGRAAFAFSQRLSAMFARTAPLLVSRARAGCVRRCHGDLHLGNIVLIDGKPVPFDALEFSEKLATIDVLYDLAFLLMDLDMRGDRHAANVVFNAYVGEEPIGGEFDGLACLPLFLACRAGVRAIVAIARTAQLEGQRREEERLSAKRHVTQAAAYLNPPPPLLIAIGGLSGTGKSTIGARLASSIGPAPGALHVRSDVERKRLFGVPETQRLERQHYRLGTAHRVYGVLEDKALSTLAAGHAVIADAVFAQPEERAAIEAIARALGLDFVGLWLTAPAETLIERVERRRGDASDADRRVVSEQLEYDLGEITWRRIDAGGDLAHCLKEARQALLDAHVRLEG